MQKFGGKICRNLEDSNKNDNFAHNNSHVQFNYSGRSKKCQYRKQDKN